MEIRNNPMNTPQPFAPTEGPGSYGNVPPSFAPVGGPAGGGYVAPPQPFNPTEGHGNYTPVPPAFGPTEGPGGGYGNFPPTVDPRIANPAPGGPFPGRTEPADGWNANGGAVNPFSVPTTIGTADNSGAAHPVVGWLVCINGPLRGTDWRIHDGYNYIGREAGDIHIQGDNQISREKHAMVAYHFKKRTFFVGPAEGRNIIEVNDEPVFNATKLNAYDIITVGSTRLLFVPLCGEQFDWNT